MAIVLQFPMQGKRIEILEDDDNLLKHGSMGVRAWCSCEVCEAAVMKACAEKLVKGLIDNETK